MFNYVKDLIFEKQDKRGIFILQSLVIVLLITILYAGYTVLHYPIKLSIPVTVKGDYTIVISSKYLKDFKKSEPITFRQGDKDHIRESYTLFYNQFNNLEVSFKTKHRLFHPMRVYIGKTTLFTMLFKNRFSQENKF